MNWVGYLSMLAFVTAFTLVMFLSSEDLVAELMASPDELARVAIRSLYKRINWNDTSEDLMRHWRQQLLNQRL